MAPLLITILMPKYTFSASFMLCSTVKMKDLINALRYYTICEVNVVKCSVAAQYDVRGSGTICLMVGCKVWSYVMKFVLNV